ncbi:hypothetical protein D3C75_1022740 [compost metagenome]
MHHDHAGASAGEAVVVGVIADQRGAIGVLIVHQLGLDLGLGQGAHRDQDKCEQQTHGRSSIETTFAQLFWFSLGSVRVQARFRATDLIWLCTQ